ncbi:glycosyltransferase family 1 protein [Curvibacter sp. CHRR-16]|uniref:glycosyltransferase family 4 protein n=1 Tax=Curvibacter sp. CHRR-16 TaxID=2835872 RepID=UPI001BD94A6C|nr:glycosyltransferase family 1 protein [Curvibacter sp. CHRR-16]MBT0570836.1 glycosyltransferase family 1 protein [Curvibacter sp. CHRR-16]
MKLALVTDAWEPQVNGVVTTLVELVRELRQGGIEVEVIHPFLFKTRPCPGYAGIDLAVRPAVLMREYLDRIAPDAIHLATEGPLGWAARRYCMRRKLAFTTAYHTRFPELLQAALKVPLWISYAMLRHFHAPSAGVMVPTPSVLRLLQHKGFGNLRSWTHGVDVQQFQYTEQARTCPQLGLLPRPVSLFVGRASYEKNIQAFLELDLPGTKVVCGVGPLQASLRERYPSVRWLGVLSRPELAQVYAAADVFVMPSRHETFGLVMLEAMSCGTPVAAYPVEGPLEVVGSPAAGGVLHEDLKTAWQAALAIPRHAARSRALQFGWGSCAHLFAQHLVSNTYEKPLAFVGQRP